ncbi:MAG: SusC/RagA family TonB-linked outer membrane protein, partial [Bacteroidia bacterium]|nr:SusC/RagA family TonB-linked outer membrane protein [Bacteroidia bacterium]
MKKWWLFHGTTPWAIKIVRKMKLTALMVCISAFWSLAFGGYAQSAKLTVVMENATVKNILGVIEDQSEFRFFYSGQVDVERKTSVNLKDGKIFDILDEIFENTNVKYEVYGRQIALIDKSETFFDKTLTLKQEAMQQKTISGKVTDTRNQPLPGVTVVVKGTTQGTVTNADGGYSITNIPANATLQFSFVGMKSQEVAVGSQTNINVVMEEETIGIEEVVAIGYGTQKKVNLTGAVAHMNSDVIEKRAVANVGQALQGLIPNLNVSISNGKPNTDPSFNIRGATSISGSSFVSGSPYILIDGIEGDINMINPEDIESISVLKDAASAAIYGARAANGVVLVVTKQGLKNKTPKITYSNMFEFSKPTNFPDRLNTYEMALAYNAANEARHAAAKFNDEYLTTIKNYVDNPETAPVYLMDGNVIRWAGNTNPYDEGVRDWAPMQKHNVTVSGGDKKMGYYTSFGYQNQEGIYAYGTDNAKRYN